DKLDAAEKKNLELLHEMFDDQLFPHLVIVLTHADSLEREDGEDELKRTIEDHRQALRGLPAS
ncbi:MAG: hypothetical protein AAF252_10140, partial [Pseudomonadota bacterium]